MNIAVFGANGRVGKKVVEIAKKRGHNVCEIDKDGEQNPLEKIDAVIDFSTAQATADVCAFCIVRDCPLISGVTGRNVAQDALLDDLRKRVKVIEKANFSQGAAFVEKVCALAGKELYNWDAEIVEIHRKGKADAPSGTAKRFASVIAQNKGSFSTVTVHSVRCGSNFGTHEIIFAANGESVTVTHRAENVEIFALGAVVEAERII